MTARDTALDLVNRVIADFCGEVVGVEILNVSRRVPPEQLSTLQFETV